MSTMRNQDLYFLGFQTMNKPDHKLRVFITLVTALSIGGCNFEPEIIESRTMTCEKYRTKLQWNEWSDGRISVNWQHPKRIGQWEPFEGLPYRSPDKLHEQVVACSSTGTYQYACEYAWTTDNQSLEHKIDWMTQQMIFEWNTSPTEVVQCY